MVAQCVLCVWLAAVVTLPVAGTLRCAVRSSGLFDGRK
jgi:hypothetical protein